MSRLAQSDLAAARQPSRPYAHVLEATRKSLLNGLKDQADDQSWQRFFDTYGGAIHGLAMKAGMPPAEADDVLQETMICIARKMPEFRYDPEAGSFKGWLFKIARRRIADHFRKLRPSVSLDTDFPVAADNSLEAQWEDEWRRNLLKNALDRVKNEVSARQWQMFDLAALQNWPMERITTLLGANRATVYVARMRISRRVREVAAQLEREDPDLRA